MKAKAFASEQIKSVDNRGTFDESDPNIYFQSVQQGVLDKNVTPVNIQVDSVPNFDNVKDLKNWIQENLNLLGDVTIKDNNRIVKLSKTNISRSLKGIGRNDVKRNSYSSLKELIENAVYGYNKSVDSRHSQRNKGQEIYYNAFVYNDKIYGVEISVDIPKSENSPNVYAGHKIKVLGITEVSSKEGLLDSTSTNISISDIQSLFNPADNTVYQSKNTARGFYQLDKNLITILKDGNVDTVIHEYAHWYLNTLASLEGSSQKVDDALADIRKFLKNDGSKFSDKQHEKFAKACEKYFYSGYAKNNKLKAIFEDIKNILHSVYDKLFDKDGRPYFAEFTEEDNKHIKELFDDIFAVEKIRVKNVVFDKVDKLEQMILDVKTKEKQELAEIEKFLFSFCVTFAVIPNCGFCVGRRVSDSEPSPKWRKT